LILRAKLNQILAVRSGQPIERVERDTDRDTWLSADQSLEYGLIDKILTDRASL